MEGGTLTAAQRVVVGDNSDPQRVRNRQQQYLPTAAISGPGVRSARGVGGPMPGVASQSSDFDNLRHRGVNGEMQDEGIRVVAGLLKNGEDMVARHGGFSHRECESVVLVARPLADRVVEDNHLRRRHHIDINAVSDDRTAEAVEDLQIIPAAVASVGKHDVNGLRGAREPVRACPLVRHRWREIQDIEMHSVAHVMGNPHSSILLPQ